MSVSSPFTSDVQSSLAAALTQLTPKSRECILRLLDYQAPPNTPLTPNQRLAAVLVLLFERDEKLYVLLTTRSKKLRSHPGQTALPGGKVDEGESGDPVLTARREAFEEVALPMLHSSIHTITLLPPFLSLYKLIVTPVVALLTDLTLLSQLRPNEGEVDACFDHPLEALLDPDMLRSVENKLADRGGENWPYETEFHDTSDNAWMHDTVYRMHRFRSTGTPVKGLTADILLLAAEIAYGRPPTFERYAPKQVMFDDAIRWVTEARGPENGHAVGAGSATAGLTSRESLDTSHS